MTPSEHFNPDNLRLPMDGLGTTAHGKKNKLPRHRNGERFLKGPIPWPWLQRASRLPGKALAVGLVLWFEAGCRKAGTISFRLSQAVAMEMHANTARRGLRALEVAKLVTIRQRPGRYLEVTILDFPP
jgi:hypothetical protein